ncbi:hypothetical protein EXIGLDRAFT_766890 [Exidia glandulosa HHB12029]|uniref:AhpC-TSA-domain-containing protein n=1 Tax=Exidia glandulosa HHB12029 TaxID=1314781 RepID=A0A165JEK1_EXIGL|nr:hypothetical protein EXIGLDRAFT_766890 [Exidia glandulosa HHB12029]
MASIQLIQIAPYVPPPPVIAPSRHFPPSARRLMRTPSLSTITDRRESGTSFDSVRRSSSSASSSSVQLRVRPRSVSSASSGSTLSSDSQHTQSSSRHELAPVHVQDSSTPPSSFPHLEPLQTSLSTLPPTAPQSATELSSSSHSPLSPNSRKRGGPPEPPFFPLVPPSEEQLERAAALDILAHDGARVRFGDLFRNQRTIVLFIRHFWCPLCQDYMYSVARSLDPAALDRAGVRLVIVSNGSPSMIKSYRQIFRLPPSIPLFTDPSRALYNAMGMTRRTLDAGPEPAKGEYVRHGYWPGIGMVVKNALKTRMPLTANGGDVKQLGGEFILGPGLACSYTSRMSTTRSHTSIRLLLDRAGVPLRQPTPEEERVVRAVRSLPARALRPAPNNAKKEKENVSDHGHVVQRLMDRDDTLEPEPEEDRARRDELREICDRRLNRRGGLKHLQWEGDCGLYSGSETEGEDPISRSAGPAYITAPPRLMVATPPPAPSSPRSQVTAVGPASPRFRTSPPPPSPGPAYLAGDGQMLVTAHSDRLLSASYAHQERARRISDPGPALVAAWLAGVRA